MFIFITGKTKKIGVVRTVAETENVKKILLIDDHPVVRQGLRQLLEQEPDIVVCGEAEDSKTALQLINKLNPDVIIVDLSLNGENGLTLIKRVKTDYPELPCLVLSMHDEVMYAERALRVGATGYIMKHEKPEKVISAIRKILKNEIYLSETMASSIVHKLIKSGKNSSGTVIDNLSNRELEVFQLVGQGKTTRQISEQLHVSVKTTESHRARIKEKMGFKNAAELVQFAIKWSHIDAI